MSIAARPKRSKKVPNKQADEQLKQDRIAARPSGERNIRRVVHIKRLVATIVVLVLSCVAVYFWHGYQHNRIANVFLARATRLNEDGEHFKAASYLHRYIQLHPDDADVRIRLAQTFDRSAKSGGQKARAIDLFSQAIGQAPREKQCTLRRRMTELLLEVGRYQNAQREAEMLLDENSDDVTALRVRALSLYAQFRSGSGMPVEQIVAAFERALKHQPANVELAATLAHIYQVDHELLSQDEQNANSARVIDQLVAADTASAEARLARYAYRANYERPNEDEPTDVWFEHLKDDLDAALESDPENWRVLITAAGHALQQKKMKKAGEYYEKAIQQSPEQAAAYFGKVEALMAQDKTKEAIGVLRRGLKSVGQHHFDLNGRLAELLIEEGELAEAHKVFERLQKSYRSNLIRLTRSRRIAMQNALAIVKARLSLKKDDPFEALRLLEPVVVTQQSRSQADKALQAQTLLLLAEAYRKTNQWDEAANTYEQAAALHPDVVRPHIAAAAAWSVADRPEQAIRKYRQALAVSDSAKIWLALATAEFGQQLQRDPKERRWQDVERAIRKAKEAKDADTIQNGWRLKLLEADMLLQQTGDEIRERVFKAIAAKCLQMESDHADSPELLHRLVLIYERLDCPREADRCLAKLRHKGYEDVIPFKLTKAQLIAIRGKPDEAIRLLKSELGSTSKSVRRTLRFTLAQMYHAQGKLPEAREQLSELHKIDPSDISVLVQLAELSQFVADRQDLQNWERKLRQIEGEGGSHWRYYRAVRLAAQSQNARDPRLEEAMELQMQLESSRPRWSRTQSLRGLICEHQGKSQDAILAYESALKLGERRLHIYERLVSLLFVHNPQQAQHYLTKLKRFVPFSHNLSRLALGTVAQSLDQINEAIALARTGIKHRPNDPFTRLWLGNLLALDGQVMEAENAFRVAVKMAPQNVPMWNGLFSFYLNANRTADARRTLSQCIQQVVMPETQKALVLAEGHELLGEHDEAEVHFERAAELGANEARIQIRVAQFYLRRDQNKAVKYLRRALRVDPRSNSARRTLAGLLARRADDKSWQEARRLLERDKTQEEHISNRRLEATLLAARGGKENLRQSREILNYLIEESGQSAPSDRFLLALIYESSGEVSSARDAMLPLVVKPSPDPDHLSKYIDLLLRHKLTEEVRSWLVKLERVKPDVFTTLSLRARWLHQQQKDPEVETIVEEFATNQLKTLDQVRSSSVIEQIGNLYMSTENHVAAARWYEKLVQRDPTKYGLLAMSLADAGKINEAIALCTRAIEADESPQTVSTLVSVLTSIGKIPDDASRIDQLLADAEAHHGDNQALLINMANMRLTQGDYMAAQRLYERILSEDPDELISLNNLAAMLAEDPSQHVDSLSYVDRAISKIDPTTSYVVRSSLLDTKGTILLLNNETQQAVSLLEDAVATINPDPRYLLHLAVAYERLEKSGKARGMLKRALENKLTNRFLTKTDQRWLHELRGRLL